MDHHGVKRFAYLKAHYPDLYEKAKARLAGVRDAVNSSLDKITLEVP